MNKLVCILVCLLLLTACHDDENTRQPETTTLWQDVTVAVVLPMHDGLDQQWRQTLELCANNMEYACKGLEQGIRLHYEWYDEDSKELQQIATQLAHREDVTAVIGGFYSSNAEQLASVLSRNDKPFFTTATTEQLVRGYSAWGNLWAMAETDITQCEVLLTKVAMRGAKTVALVVKDENLDVHLSPVTWNNAAVQTGLFDGDAPALGMTVGEETK